MMNIYLIAKKLSHSFSPQIHSRLASYNYKLCPLLPEELPQFFKERNFDGLNVTIPYKTEVINYLDDISPEAREIGAVNTVVNRGGVLTGYNTDYYGFMYAVKRSGIDVCGKKAVVIGGGGASKPVCLALGALGAQSVRVLTHKLNNPETLPQFFDAQVLVNASPVGMYPENGKAPVNLEDFSHCEGVIDLIYNPSLTALLLDARARGIKYENGLSMLVAQAKRACEIFTGSDIEDDMIETVRKDVESETKNIIIVGMPGSGKTTVGELVSKKLNRKFCDCDKFLEENGTSPAETIKSKGEAFFRKEETEALSHLCSQSGLVISTGGGAVTVKENYGILHQNGFVVYLSRGEEFLETAGRPLSLKNGVQTLFKEREPLYESFSDIKISNDTTPEGAAQKIVDSFLRRK